MTDTVPADTGLIDAALIDAVTSLFADTCTHETVQAAERDGWATRVWDKAAQMGLPWIGIPESAGGSGGSLSDALAVLRVAGAHAAPVPLAETGVLAGWLLSGAGGRIGPEPLTVVPGRPDDSLRLVDGRATGVAHRVPWARSVVGIVALFETPQGALVGLLPKSGLRIEKAANLAGEPRDTVEADDLEPIFLAPAADGVDARSLRYRGALTRVALMAGALERMSAITQRYTAERQQFGRAIRSFQAVQQHLVVCAQEAAMVGMAASVAAREASRGEAQFEIAAGKILAGQAAQIATRAAHQAHGAMGMTQEYSLHQFSRRLWSWRNEYGSEKWWSRELGTVTAEAGADQLYPLIAGGSAAINSAVINPV